MKEQKYQNAMYTSILLLDQMIRQENDQFASVRGRNFYGQIQLKGDSLKFDITDLKNGRLYLANITNAILEKEPRKYIPFKKVEELFNEFMISEHMEINDENSLLLPVQMSFRERTIDLKVPIQLEERKFNSEGESCKIIYERFSKIHEESINWRKDLTPQPIKFQANKAVPNFKLFNINELQKKVTFVGQSKHTLLYHDTPLPKKGIFHFKVKIMKTHNKAISFGIAGEDVRQKVDFYTSSHFIGGYIGMGDVLTLSGKSPGRTVTPTLKIVDGESIFKVEVDMNRKLISFHLNGTSLYTTSFWKEMENIRVYPVISLRTNGDSIQFIDE